MTAERWRRIQELFDRVEECDPHTRLQLLEDAGSTDPELRRQVESLFGCSDSADDCLRALVQEEAAAIGWPADREQTEASSNTRASLPDEAVPDIVIGHYRLLERVGEGGMGEVWLASQSEPFRRRVALKLLKTVIGTREVVARFESESQALALMDHPAIAKVLDAGCTSVGRPYFVMEYVPGQPITEYCDKRRLTLDARLRLFIQVCEAVRHAHQKAVIHRDLKPSNILVSDSDGMVSPKIIDFGVAKAVSRKLTQDTLVTRAGALLGTPEYMSPEQTGSFGDDIDTRTDVYALGVILYELLAGIVPIDLRGLGLEEILRKVRLEDPPRPSAKLRGLSKEVKIVADNRATQPKNLMRDLRGDLDSIVLKALEKDRTRRYPGPAELAADIEHYLRHEPVTARPASLRYRSWKYTHRHRVGVAFATAFVLLLIAAIIDTSRAAIRAIRFQEQARAVTDFMRNDVLLQASSDSQGEAGAANPDPNLTVRTALDRAAAKIAGKFSRQPLAEAAVRHSMGAAYLQLTLYPQAEVQLVRALDLRRRVQGKESRDALLVQRLLSVLYVRSGRLKQGEKLASETLAVDRRVLGSNDPDTLNIAQDLANIYQQVGKYAESEALNRELLTRARRLEGESPRTLRIEANLAGDYVWLGKYPEAERVQKRLVEDTLRVHGLQKRDTLDVMGNLALTVGFEGKFAEAETLYRKVVDGLVRLEGKEDYDTFIMTEGLAWACVHDGKYAEGDSLFLHVLNSQRRMLGNDHPFTLMTLSDWGAAYRYRGMYQVAETLLVEAVDGRRRKLGIGHPDTLVSLGDLGWVYVMEGKNVAAEHLLEEPVAKFPRGPTGIWQQSNVECALGAALAAEKQYARAEPLLTGGLRDMLVLKRTIPADEKFDLEAAARSTVKLYRDWHKLEQASKWQEKAHQAGLSI
jgi:serine/threonine protein kinase/tetratricopeptide (TPR) repeat protein